jgi:hypothetical protein
MTDMSPLYQTIQPLLLSINQEGGNFVGHLFTEGLADAIDTGAATDANLAMIKAKIEEKIAAYRGKRDHRGFSQIFEAYSEGLIYLAAQARGVLLRAVPDGAQYGKTPDFVTVAAPEVGFEVKTIDIFDPLRTYDDVMDRGFEAGYEAGERAKAAAKISPKGVGVGITEMEIAPHGAGAEEKAAVVQTIQKIRSNVKAGQYEGRPTFLVVSLARLGIHPAAVELRRRGPLDADWDERPSGHLFAIAANRLADNFYGRSRGSPGITNLGPLGQAGTLLDHPFVAGLVFLETIRSELGGLDPARNAFRFHGVWNDAWEASATFTPEEKAAAKQSFESLCLYWNDMSNSRDDQIPDLAALRAELHFHIDRFVKVWRGRTPDDVSLGDFMVEADRLFFQWQAAELGIPEAVADYVPRQAVDAAIGCVDPSGEPVLFFPGASSHRAIPMLDLVKRRGQWLPEAVSSKIRANAIVI